MERGVYWAVATKGGRPQAFSVDSSGNEVERLILANDSWSHAEQIIEYLWHRLDRIDPVAPRPELRLVNPSLPVAKRRDVPDTYDPYTEAPRLGGPWRKPW